jgi:hypothetical protein
LCILCHLNKNKTWLWIRFHCHNKQDNNETRLSNIRLVQIQSTIIAMNISNFFSIGYWFHLDIVEFWSRHILITVNNLSIHRYRFHLTEEWSRAFLFDPIDQVTIRMMTDVYPAINDTHVFSTWVMSLSVICCQVYSILESTCVLTRYEYLNLFDKTNNVSKEWCKSWRSYIIYW